MTGGSSGNTRCCVVGCNNKTSNSPGTRFYSFSVKKHKSDQRDLWIKAVKRKNIDGSPWQPNKYSRICSKHFINNEKSDHPLHPNYVPTIFTSQYLSNKSKRSMEMSINRFNRRNKRLVTAGPSKEGSTNLSTLESTLESTREMETQVDFLEKTETNENKRDFDANIFICNRFCSGDICEAETQASFQWFANVKYKTSTEDKSCGNNTVLEDKCVGPDPIDLNGDSLINCTAGFHGYSSIVTNQDMLDLAGVTLPVFELLLSCFKEKGNDKLSKRNLLLMFLFRMKLGLTVSALGVLFNAHRTTVSRNFESILEQLIGSCKNLISWPSRETVQATIPEVFKENYQNCRVIIDCTEFQVEQPPTVSQRVYFYSHYKKGYRIKILVGCTPSGHISFVSNCYGGRTTDAYITNSSGFLNLLEAGDTILADKGFPEIKTVLDDTGKGILLVMPPFLRDNTFSAEQVLETKKVASVRIHIERIMQRIKTYRILSKFTIKMLPHANDIVYMCCILVNLQQSILKSRNDDIE